MSYEYKIEYQPNTPIAFDVLRKRIGERVFDTIDFSISEESNSELIVAISRSDSSRIAFSKTVEYLLSISDTVIVSER